MNLDAISGLEELVFGATLLLLPVPCLVVGARDGRKLLAGAPGVLCFALFALAFAQLHLASGSASNLFQSAYGLGELVVVILLLPSVWSLRNRLLGLIHFVTLAGVLWSWFIGLMLLARDSL